MTNIALVFPSNSPGITKDQEYVSVFTETHDDRYAIVDDNGVLRVFALGLNPSIKIIHKESE